MNLKLAEAIGMLLRVADGGVQAVKTGVRLFAIVYEVPKRILVFVLCGSAREFRDLRIAELLKILCFANRVGIAFVAVAILRELILRWNRAGKKQGCGQSRVTTKVCPEHNDRVCFFGFARHELGCSQA